MDLINTLQLAAMTGPHDGSGEWWWIGRLLVFLLWIVVIFFVIRWASRGRWRGPSPMERAHGILAERFARGEIDADEYRRRSDDLKA